MVMQRKKLKSRHHIPLLTNISDTGSLNVATPNEEKAGGILQDFARSR